MTTPQNSSPFAIGNSSSTAAAPKNFEQPTIQTNQDDFILRTMQSDLEYLQKNKQIKKEITPKTSKPQISPAVKPQLAKKDTLIPGEKIPSPIKQTSASSVHLPKSPEIKEITPEQRIAQLENKPSSMRIIVVIIIILIISILVLGGYYSFVSKRNQVAIEPAKTAPQQTQLEEPKPESQNQTPSESEQSPIANKYLQDKPNYLVLDLTTFTPDEIKKSLADTAMEIKNLTDTTNSPYEFIVVDKNNNPVTFPIFATASKLNLSKNILSNLSQNFSLYFYKDGEDVRLAFSAEYANKDSLVKEIAKQETTFAKDASLLFLDAQPDKINGTFSSSSYDGFSIRYMNLNAEGNLSIDYTITSKQLVLGTSKNTLRAVLDKTKTADLAQQPQSTVTSKSAATTDTQVKDSTVNTGASATESVSDPVATSSQNITDSNTSSTPTASR